MRGMPRVGLRQLEPGRHANAIRRLRAQEDTEGGWRFGRGWCEGEVLRFRSGHFCMWTLPSSWVACHPARLGLGANRNPTPRDSTRQEIAATSLVFQRLKARSARYEKT